jgi:hypothetical protein
MNNIKTGIDNVGWYWSARILWENGIMATVRISLN